MSCQVILPYTCKSLYTVAWRFQFALTALLFIGLSWNFPSLCIFRRWIRIWYLDIAIVISFSVMVNFFIVFFLEEQWPCQATNIYMDTHTANVKSYIWGLPLTVWSCCTLVYRFPCYSLTIRPIALKFCMFMYFWTGNTMMYFLKP